MLAAGGVLILALAGTYEKESDKEPGTEFWREYGQKMAVKGGAALFKYMYPGTAAAGRVENGEGEEES